MYELSIYSQNKYYDDTEYTANYLEEMISHYYYDIEDMQNHSINNVNKKYLNYSQYYHGWIDLSSSNFNNQLIYLFLLSLMFGFLACFICRRKRQNSQVQIIDDIKEDKQLLVNV